MTGDMEVEVEGYPVVVQFSLRWGEMDALGHANNARFFTWFESARIALFEQVGIDAAAPRPVGPILATTTCDFLRPVRYPARLQVGARIGHVGNTSFLTEYQVTIEGSEDPVARGSGVVVMFDYDTGAKVRVSDELRQRLAGMKSHVQV